MQNMRGANASYACKYPNFTIKKLYASYILFKLRINNNTL